jgi:hypothetical protein
MADIIITTGGSVVSDDILAPNIGFDRNVLADWQPEDGFWMWQTKPISDGSSVRSIR